jgi:hypothetical protein
MRKNKKWLVALLGLVLLGNTTPAQNKPVMVPVGEGWAANSVNAVVFRKNALTSLGDTQYIAYYDASQHVVLGKRRLGSRQWQLVTTPYTGNTRDAHNTISIMVDGKGYLHLSWDHHNNPLHYCRSVQPGSLEMTAPMPMTGKKENRVSYPEFYRLPGGDLLFFYRDGASGNGDLVMNRYSTATRQWTRLQNNLIDGEGQRNAYCQVAIDIRGTIHLSWVWRETPDVASNHDLCYARSADGGKTWQRSTGEIYRLPITAATAEYACRIPQHSELINQTSMSADEQGNPCIATYWKAAGSAVPQYFLVYQDKGQWQTQQVTRRHTPFSLSGAGTKKIPVSRPQVMLQTRGKHTAAFLVFRDEERGSRVSLAYSADMRSGNWNIQELTTGAYGQWEPSYDTNLWQSRNQLHLFVQQVAQGDGEKIEKQAPTTVNVLEWQPGKKE